MTEISAGQIEGEVPEGDDGGATPGQNFSLIIRQLGAEGS